MRAFLFALLLVWGSVAAAQNCSTLHTGRFRVPGDAGNPMETLVNRTDRYQFEEVKAIGLKIRLDLKWTSDCTYELSNPKVLEGEAPWGPQPSKLILKVVITRVGPASYFTRMTNNLNEFVMEKEIMIESAGKRPE